jgi:hypothetical protein
VPARLGLKQDPPVSPAPSRRYDFTLNPARQTVAHAVGREREPVLVIDQVMSDPRELVDFAAHEVRFEPPPPAENYYPGVLGAAPLTYVSALVAALRPEVEAAFELQGVAPVRATCNYSMVTFPPERLVMAQRMPHVDTDDPLQFAILHYLCDARFGGTAFYRHRSTGFESLTPERMAPHRAALAEELERSPPAQGYIVGDTPLYEQTAQFDAVFDRVLVYRSRVFHSGQIDPVVGLSADPRQGRLTANIFLNYGAASKKPN